MNYDFMFGCVFFVLMLQNLFLMISNDGKTNALNEVREKEYERYKEIYALKKQVEVLEHKLSSKS
jgi:hypothetical protein